jgi:hypothetical protein
MLKYEDCVEIDVTLRRKGNADLHFKLLHIYCLRYLDKMAATELAFLLSFYCRIGPST